MIGGVRYALTRCVRYALTAGCGDLKSLTETHSFTIDSMPRVAWKSFTEGRALVRGLGLKGEKGWEAWSKSGQRPSDIPATQTGRTATTAGSRGLTGLAMGRTSRVEELHGGAGARAGAGAEGREGVEAWSKSGQRPSDIPAHPDRTYRDDGWISWPDWLGNGGASRVEELHGGAGARAGAGAEGQKGVEGVEQERTAPLRHPGQPRQDVPRRRLDLVA